MEKLSDKTLLQETYTEIEQTLLKGVLRTDILFVHLYYHYTYESLWGTEMRMRQNYTRYVSEMITFGDVSRMLTSRVNL